MAVLEEATWTPPNEFDEYRIIRPIGRGSMGQVYLAHDLVLERPVAVKFLGSYRPDSIERERFLVEARAVARIQHPNVMAIYRVGDLEGRLYLVSEYIRGQSLAELALPLPWPRVLEIGVGLARGLGAAHRQGVLHRDIKLSNAVIDEGGQVKLLDFGLAKLVDVTGDRQGGAASSGGSAPTQAPAQAPAASSSSPGSPSPSASSSQNRGIADESKQDLLMRAANNARQMIVQRLADTAKFEPLAATSPTPRVRREREDSGGAGGGWSGSASITRQGTVMGTPHYMAPELWLADPASRRSDVYALGVLLFILAAGKPPHDAESPFDLAMLVQEKDPPRLLDLAPAIEPKLAAIIDRCLERDPYQRYSTAEELRSALEVLSSPRRAGGAGGVPVGNPYRGLQAFEAEHRSLFFGRSLEIRAVLERLRADSFVCVAGDSGVGKSSLCRAGVVPMVNEGNLDPSKTWRTVTMTPGRYPKQSFVAVVARGFGMNEDDVSSLLGSEPEALVRALRKQLGETGGCMIFIDQFEEFVTIAEPSEVALIGPLVVRLLAGIPGLKVMATVRGDFLTRVATVPGLGDEVARGIFLLRPLSPEGAREAVVGPAQAHGVAFENDDLVDELVAAGVKGSLPLLQFALAELWESRDKSTSVISAAELRKIGGVTGALARHADGVLAGLLPVQRTAARRLLMRLVTLENTRASLTLDELAATHEAAKAALDALVRGRLLVVKEAGDRMVYEIAHEALVGGWAQLAGWLEDEKEARAVLHRLEAAASEWERLGKGRAGLWSAAQVGEAKIVERAELRPREVAFLEASESDAARAKVLRRAAIAAVPVVIGLVVMVMVVRDARRLQERVDEQVRDARAEMEVAVGIERRRANLERESFAAYDAMQIVEGEETWRRATEAMDEESAAYSRVAQKVEMALSLDPRSLEARELLADVLAARVSLARARRDRREVADLLARLAIYDSDGSRQKRLLAPAKVSVHVGREGVPVRIAEYRPDGQGRYVLGEARPLGTTPLDDVEIDGGSYVLEFGEEGVEPSRYPVFLVGGAESPVDIVLASSKDVPAGYVYVPAGHSFFGFAGSDDFRLALHNTVPMHRVWVPSFIIGRHEVTFTDFLSFLDDIGEEERRVRVPHVDATGSDAAFQVIRGDDGAWSLKWAMQEGAPTTVRAGERLPFPARGEGASIDWLQMPVLGVTVDDVRAYAEWLDRSGRVPRARLCNEIEWERAARGADSRIFPHGDVLLAGDANFDLTYAKDVAKMGPEAVGERLLSRSPWGVDDLTGNVFEWVSSSLKDGAYVVRGGAFAFVEVTARAVHREELDPSFRAPQLGARVCASWAPAE